MPVELRVRFVRAGDVFFSEKTQDLWMVTAIADRTDRPARMVTVMRSGSTHTAELDLDVALSVLTATPERDALTTLRDELAARLIERT